MDKQSRFSPTAKRLAGTLYGAAVGAVTLAVDNGCTGYTNSALNYVHDAIAQSDGEPLRASLYLGLAAGGAAGYFFPDMAKAIAHLIGRGVKKVAVGTIKHAPGAVQKARNQVKKSREEYAARNTHDAERAKDSELEEIAQDLF